VRKGAEGALGELKLKNVVNFFIAFIAILSNIVIISLTIIMK
jgi:hypothetical protein